MTAKPLSIHGAWLMQSRVFADDRGTFSEWFKSSLLTELTGESFEPVQANVSVSNAGVIRGIHYSLAPRGQAKLVTVLRGSILDVAIDVRVGSPTFGSFESAVMTAGDGQAMFLRSDMAHAFQALEDNTVVSYLVSSEYSPTDEKEISPMCSRLNISWHASLSPVLSEKDRAAPDLDQQHTANLLPTFTTKGHNSK
jgi:dTDP-4-dehydrorhamnose 3,5-epimerase